ncbi:hypothetical protein HKT33_30835, partial [Pseudomonas aeruginosa]|nr:hypothetical protein [Pseudomonas aeruginosa]
MSEEPTVSPPSPEQPAAQPAKPALGQLGRAAARAQVVDAYREKVGEIISGTVKKVTR